MSAETRLPETLQGDGLLLRRWLVSDAEILATAIADSLELLRPWMPWVAQEPQTLTQRREMLAEWQRAWAAGGDSHMAVLLDRQVAGAGGLHRRGAADTLHLGYWTHAAFLRRGVAVRCAALMTGAALSVPGIAAVEIHHDAANLASAPIPRRLGYEFLGERRVEVSAPGETGVDRAWRITIDGWSAVAGTADHATAAEGLSA